MALTGLNTYVAGATLTAAQLNSDNTTIAAKFNAGITTADLSASAGIVNTQLANDDYEFVVHLQVKAHEAAAGAWSAVVAHTTLPLAVVALPGSTTDGIAYTVLSASYACLDTGDVAQNTTYKVEWGAFTGAAGAWAATSTVISSNNITSTAAGGMLAGNASLNTTALTLVDANPRFLALFVTAVGTNALDSQGAGLFVTLKLKRTSGLRA